MKKLTRDEMKRIKGGDVEEMPSDGDGDKPCFTNADCSDRLFVCPDGGLTTLHGYCSPNNVCRRVGAC